MSSGERDLGTILATMEVVRRPGTFAYAQVTAGSPAPAGAVAMIDEGATVAYVVEADSAAATATFRAAWLTISVPTALDGVGLTAALSGALAAARIPANVLAGFVHDHVLVPADRADDAVRALLGLTGR